jgi:hypothetical protein
MSARYILITQCLQNDYFFNSQCELCLPLEAFRKLLIGKNYEKDDLTAEDNSQYARVTLAKQDLDKGPLGLFLKGVTSRRKGEAILHIVNIRDWHKPSDSYDRERAKYGAHCEAGTWGAEYVDGLSEYLDPGKKEKMQSEANEKNSRFFKKDNIHGYHVYSNSIFDFKPRYGQEQKDDDSMDFEDLIDVLVLGSDEQVNELETNLGNGRNAKELAEKIAKKPKSKAKVYMAVIGLYTDIKILILLAGLVSRYNIRNLAISDTLTASSSIESHLGALDFINKLLGVEVISGLNDLVRFLGGEGRIPNEPEIVAAGGFSNYVQYFQDKQNVLAHNDSKLNEYVALTQKRSKDLYQTVSRANQFLLYGGVALLAVTIIAAAWALFQPSYVSWTLPAVTGGLSLTQLVTVFFGQPMARLQKNLTNFASFRMILESHSLKMALARFHLTTAETLRGNLAASGAKEAAEIQIKLLKDCLAAIDQTEKTTCVALAQLGLGDQEMAKIVAEEKDKRAEK